MVYTTDIAIGINRLDTCIAMFVFLCPFWRTKITGAAGASVAALVVATVAVALVATAPFVVAPVTPVAYISLCEILLETLSNSLLNLMEFLV